MLPLAAADLFRRIARHEGEAAGASAYRVSASFVEVYQERVYDLLNGKRGEPLSLRGRDDGSVYAVGASELSITAVAQLLRLVREGTAARCTEGNSVHEHSSRSHALLQLVVEQRWYV